MSIDTCQYLLLWKYSSKNGSGSKVPLHKTVCVTGPENEICRTLIGLVPIRVAIRECYSMQPLSSSQPQYRNSLEKGSSGRCLIQPLNLEHRTHFCRIHTWGVPGSSANRVALKPLCGVCPLKCLSDLKSCQLKASLSFPRRGRITSVAERPITCP